MSLLVSVVLPGPPTSWALLVGALAAAHSTVPETTPTGLHNRRTVGLVLMALALIAIIALRVALGMDAATGIFAAVVVLIVGLVLAVRGSGA